jgi:hypothetical protein
MRAARASGLSGIAPPPQRQPWQGDNVGPFGCTLRGQLGPQLPKLLGEFVAELLPDLPQRSACCLNDYGLAPVQFRTMSAIAQVSQSFARCSSMVVTISSSTAKPARADHATPSSRQSEA